MLGGLDKYWEGKGREWGNCETFLENFDLNLKAK